MARQVTLNRRLINTGVAWAFGLLIFFPILWTILTSFKTEAEAISLDPSLFGFDWTLENYQEVNSRSNYPRYFMNSVIIAVGSTLLGLIIAVPAAWSMAFVPSKKTRGILLWMLSTKMLPPVGVLIPIYLIFRDWGLLDSRVGLVMVLTMVNLPIIVWMLFTYFREIPGEILEAARMDGASLKSEIIHVLTPMALPGIASTLLLNVILAWNEAFWTSGTHYYPGGTVDAVHSQLLQSGRSFLRKAVCCFHDGNSTSTHPWLVQSETIGPWPDIRRG